MNETHGNAGTSQGSTGLLDPVHQGGLKIYLALLTFRMLSSPLWMTMVKESGRKYVNKGAFTHSKKKKNQHCFKDRGYTKTNLTI